MSIRTTVMIHASTNQSTSTIDARQTIVISTMSLDASWHVMSSHTRHIITRIVIPSISW